MSTRAYHSAIGALAAAMLLVPAAARAQLRAPSVLSTPTESQLLPNGAYQFSFTPATVRGKRVARSSTVQMSGQVSHTGTQVTITMEDSTTFHGAASSTHLKAAGQLQGQPISIELGGSSGQASGTWSAGGQRLTGTVTVAPAPRYQTHTAKQGGCNSIKSCVEQWTGFSWSTIFG